jgi:hypothetical protein
MVLHIEIYIGGEKFGLLEKYRKLVERIAGWSEEPTFDR